MANINDVITKSVSFMLPKWDNISAILVRRLLFTQSGAQQERGDDDPGDQGVAGLSVYPAIQIQNYVVFWLTVAAT